jgi:hypothetical protein
LAAGDGKGRLKMKRSTVLMSLLLVVVLVASAGAVGNCNRANRAPSAGFSDSEIPIQVSPHVIVLDSVGDCVTVHADIAFSQVNTATVTLNGIAAIACKPDNRGDLVAKFSPDEVKAIVAPPEVLFTLTGQTVDGEVFTGSETITVK